MSSRLFDKNSASPSTPFKRSSAGGALVSGTLQAGLELLGIIVHSKMAECLDELVFLFVQNPQFLSDPLGGLRPVGEDVSVFASVLTSFRRLLLHEAHCFPFLLAVSVSALFDIEFEK